MSQKILTQICWRKCSSFSRFKTFLIKIQGCQKIPWHSSLTHLHRIFLPSQSCVSWWGMGQAFIFFFQLINLSPKFLSISLCNRLWQAQSSGGLNLFFFAPFQGKSNMLHDLCRNISHSLTTLMKCPLQPPRGWFGWLCEGASGCSSAWSLSGEERNSLPWPQPDACYGC